MEHLQARGISTRRGTTAIHREPLYRDVVASTPDDLPSSTEAELSTIALPLYPSLSEEEQQAVIAAMTEALAG
jgi:dTDP-4-amino-4,6-dideoxygalactose transaminase